MRSISSIKGNIQESRRLETRRHLEIQTCGQGDCLEGLLPVRSPKTNSNSSRDQFGWDLHATLLDCLNICIMHLLGHVDE